jgi:hypothetical protein
MYTGKKYILYSLYKYKKERIQSDKSQFTYQNFCAIISQHYPFSSVPLRKRRIKGDFFREVFMPAKKRRRGGQPGNQNARKHGFYSLYMSQPEILELLKAFDSGGVDRRVAVTRIKLKSALLADPANRRVLGDASRQLAKYYRFQNHMEKGDYTELKKFIRLGIKAAAAQFSQTNESKSEESA